MKKILFYCIMVSGFTIFLSSCEKATIDNGSYSKVYDPDAPIDTVFYNAEIQPIFESNCNGCHNSQVPILEAGVSYDNLMNGYVVPFSPSTSELYLKLTELTDGHYNRANQTQKDLIYSWISQGALNN